MKIFRINPRRFVIIVIVAVFTAGLAGYLFSNERVEAQAGRQQQGDGKKKNPNASGDPEAQKKQQEKEEEKKVDKQMSGAIITLDTRVVNVEAVVYNKKTGAVLQGLKKENFEIYEDGIKQEVDNFSTPEAPLTLVMIVEYSKIVDVLGSGTGGYFEPGRVEVLRPAYEFVRTIVKPKDFISIIANEQIDRLH